MLKVECESCRAPYQVDERRVPPGGLKMRCPKCGHTFLVTDPNAKGAAPAAPAAPNPKKGTMVGMAGPATKPALDDDPFAGLPAPKPAAPAVKPPVAPTVQQSAPAPQPPRSSGGMDFGDLNLDDLPAVAQNQDAGLPAPVRKPPPPAPANIKQTAGFEVGLPAVASPKADLPMAKPQPPKAGGGLPGGGGFGDLDLPIVAGDLPATKPLGGGAGGFGGIDLPVVANNLPAVPNNLPAPRGGGGFGEIDLPQVADNLPAPMGADQHLPAPVGDDRFLPQQANVLPQPKLGNDDFGELELPRADAAPQRPPLPVVGGESRPHNYQPPDPATFGEFSLPSADLQSLPPGATSTPPGAPPREHGAGGMQFGEVDLGGGGGDAGGEAPLASMRPAAPTPSGASFPISPPDASGAQEAQLEAQKRRARTVVIRKSSKAPKIVAGVLVVLLVGGAALALTPYGAFGSNVITDLLKSGTYRSFTEESAEAARKRLANDTYVDARKAYDDLDVARKKMARARQLSAYSALVEYTTQLRFGVDPERGSKAQLWLRDVPQGEGVDYYAVAKAAQAAVAGDLATARRGVEAASRNPKDPGQLEMAILRGEIELAARDANAAATAFKRASELSPSARASFGLARAHFMSKEYAKCKDDLAQVLAKSPQHAGALILRANLTWQTTHDDQSALRDLASVIEGSAKANAGAAELSRAYSSKGWIMFARERAGDARTSFDEAVKLDARNVSALVGQGEILYAEGRYTEALSRFDTAVGADPASVDAIVGDAKAKIALERLADAKQQLTAARTTYPKEMRVALWLGKAEEALGNKGSAEKQYNDAIELADPSAPDAISAYVALATLLAGQGRAVEAQAKLDQARGKLPDSSALQRAIGEVAAAQGHYDEAISHYEAALAKDPNDIATHFRLGVTLRRMRRMGQAGAEFDKVLAVDKDYPGLALERGLLFEESGEVQKALEQFKGALQKAPNDLDLMLRVGAAYVAIGRPDEAIPMLKKVLEARQNSAEAQHYLGRAYLKKGGLDTTGAMRYLKRAVELDPNRAEYHLYVAWAANDSPTPDLGLARAEVDKALQLDKLLADAYWQRGDVLRKGGAVDDAIRDLKKALELRPNRIEAHASLAEAYELKNAPQLAEREWQQAVAGDQEQPYWRYKYGKILLEKRQAGAAKAHLQYATTQGMQISPRPAWVIQAEFECAEALRQTGAKQEAIEHYTVFLNISPPSNPDRADAMRWLAKMGAPYQPQ
jgi:predicted Zn finger-like uncharacterized protein